MSKQMLKFFESVLKPEFQRTEKEIIKIFNERLSKFSAHYAVKTICDEAFIFVNSDIDKIVKLIGYSNSLEFKRDIKQFIPNLEWNNMSNERNILLILILHYFSVKNDKVNLTIAMKYYHGRIFSTVIKKYFKHGCKNSVMGLTLSNISSRFLIKKKGIEGNVPPLVFLMSVETQRTQYQKLNATKDKSLFDLLIYIRTKIEGVIKNIAKKYYEIDKSDMEILANRETTIGAEGEEEKVTFDTDSSKIESIINHVNQIVSSFDKESKSLLTIINSFNVSDDSVREEVRDKILLVPNKLVTITRTGIIEIHKAHKDNIRCDKSYIKEVFNVLIRNSKNNKFRNEVVSIIDNELSSKKRADIHFARNVITLFIAISFIKTQCKGL